MKKVVDGIVMEMTTEEIVSIPTAEPTEPTAEERLEALESAMLELLEVISNG